MFHTEKKYDFNDYNSIVVIEFFYISIIMTTYTHILNIFNYILNYAILNKIIKMRKYKFLFDVALHSI